MPDTRLAEILGALSLATDLANGNPLEKALRTCLIAVELAQELGASGPQQTAAYYAGMLRFIGCTAYAHELADHFGDDVQAHQVFAPLDSSRPTEVLAATVARIDIDASPLRRARAIASVVARGPRLFAAMAVSQCEVAVRLADRLRLPAEVIGALGQLQERYDGAGAPHGLGGEALSLAARVLHVANIAEIFHRQGGAQAACDEVTRRSGGHFDPGVAAAFVRAAPRLLARVDQRSVWDDALAAEPGPPARADDDLDRIAGIFADFVDLGSVYTLGHSHAVARLAEEAGAQLGLRPDERAALRRAGLLHDLGHVSVPVGVWEKRGALTAAEWERVRLHPYYTERILSRSPVLAPLASLAGSHHERLDASGYFRSAPGGYLCASARVLAAADHYQALVEARPHRPAHGPAEAARLLVAEARAGRLDDPAVHAVLAAAGHHGARARVRHPAGLTPREVEVLGWLARGLSNKDIAARMRISARTVQHHALHIYSKIGVSSRAAAALYAIEHDLVIAGDAT